MRRPLATLSLVFLALSASGCIVTSVYPFCSDTTVVFEPALLGKWQEADGTTWSFERQGDKAYRVAMTERKPGPAGDRGERQTTTFLVRLFELGGSRFLDAFPTDVADIAIGSHFLVKMELQAGTLVVRGLDTQAVNRVAGTTGPVHVHPAADGTIEEGTTREGSQTLLLAPTARLQAFIEQHQAEIFEKDGGTMKRIAGTEATGR